MSSVFVFFLFNFCLFFDRTRSQTANSLLRLTVDPPSGYATENIDVHCHILQPSIYDNVYLSVLTDNVKPSGILLMVDDTMNDCRTNENKEKHFRIHTCNSTLIHININHEVINESLHTIDYRCTQGETHVYNSYRIMKKQTARYYDQKSFNSSSALTQRFYLFLFLLLTVGQLR